jgi:glycosyltransferase involved in cell wall biosynthesis
MKNSQQTILFVVTKSVWGGAQKYVYDLATNLPADRFLPYVTAGPAPHGEANGKGTLFEKLAARHIPYHEIKNFQRDLALIRECAAGIEILRLLLRLRPQVLHTSSPKAAGIAGVAAWGYRLLTFFRYPLICIMTVHGWTIHETWRPRWQQRLIGFFSRLTNLFYHTIIVISRADYHTAIRERLAPAAKLALIPHGIHEPDYQFFSRDEARALLPLRIRNANPLIGTIGEWTTNKGHRYLIEAAIEIIKKNPDTRLVLFGWGEKKQQLSDLIQSYHLTGHISLIEGVHDAARFLKAFDIFVLPSVKEGLPYVLLEAKLAGVPIIATHVGGIPDIVDASCGILVPSADPALLADAVFSLLQKNLSSIERSPVRTIDAMIADTMRHYR